MINSESSELNQIARGNVPPNAYFSEEHVQMFSGNCSRHMTKATKTLQKVVLQNQITEKELEPSG